MFYPGVLRLDHQKSYGTRVQVPHRQTKDNGENANGGAGDGALGRELQ
jgi:hypothetical protein